MTEILFTLADTYEVFTEIGAGGFGKVYRGNHKRLKKPIAIKCENFTSEVSYEVEALRNLKHPYIPQLYDYIIDGEKVYTVMDFIEGEDFDKIISFTTLHEYEFIKKQTGRLKNKAYGDFLKEQGVDRIALDPIGKQEWNFKFEREVLNPELENEFRVNAERECERIRSFLEKVKSNGVLYNNYKFSQVQIIKWVRQILEALAYLHANNVLHCDIKPANIMLTPKGDICLIDYNVSVALSDAPVGCSQSYASPEQCELDYSSESSIVPQTSYAKFRKPKLNASRTPLEVHAKVVYAGDADDPNATVMMKKTVKLGTYSDIFSLGATVYSIMTGARLYTRTRKSQSGAAVLTIPYPHREDVKPLDSTAYSPSLAMVINRSIELNPTLRYQTAEEMLFDLNRLHELDPRTRRLKLQTAVSAVICTALFLTSGTFTFVGQEQKLVIEESLKLAGYSSDALGKGDVKSAVELALQALPKQSGIFAPPYTAQAQKALTDASGVYDLSDGYKPHGTLELDSPPFGVALSGDGSVVAVVYAYEIAVVSTETSEIIDKLPIVRSALAGAVFTTENTLLYAGADGVTAYDCVNRKELWGGEAATDIAVSANGNVIAAVYRDEQHAVIYDAGGAKIKTVDFGGRKQRIAANDTFANPNDNIFALNRDGSMLAVSFDGGGLSVFDLNSSDNNIDLTEDPAFTHFEGGFSGDYFAFSATGRDNSVFYIFDTVKYETTGGFDSGRYYGVKSDESGIYISADALLTEIDPVTGEYHELAYIGADISRFDVKDGYALVTDDKKNFMFFGDMAKQISKYRNDFSCDFLNISETFAVVGSRSSPVLRILKRKEDPDSRIFKYDKYYEHDEARVTADEKNLMLFSHRGFRVYDDGGGLVNETELPDPELVYDQQFRKESGTLDVMYGDVMRTYSARDGTLAGEKPYTPPDDPKTEVFYTDTAKIVSPLHGAPQVFDLKSGKLLCELEKDDYLTYVTQVGGDIITQYVTADGEEYGLLLDENFGTVGTLPQLTDINGGELLFDFNTGFLRKTHLYKIEEILNTVKGEERQ